MCDILVLLFDCHICISLAFISLLYWWLLLDRMRKIYLQTEVGEKCFWARILIQILFGFVDFTEYEYYLCFLLNLNMSTLIIGKLLNTNASNTKAIKNTKT